MRILLPLLIFFVLFSCSKPQEPVFKRITNIEVQEIRGGSVTVAAQALYFNPNSIGGSLNTLEVDVWANENKIGTIDQDLDLAIQPNSDFTIPIVITFPLSELTKDQGNLIGGLIKAMLNKRVDMEYKGTLFVSLAGIRFKVPFEEEEAITIKY